MCFYSFGHNCFEQFGHLPVVQKVRENTGVAQAYLIICSTKSNPTIKKRLVQFSAMCDKDILPENNI